MTQDVNTPTIELEMDSFVSPNAANDQPSDDGIDLEMDPIPTAQTPVEVTETPVALAPVESSDTGTLVDALTAIATQGATNAAGQVSGSLANGTMRGVGFNSAQGYITALQNGVKQATADSYVQTLRQSYGYTQEQIDALTISIIQQNDLPVGPGTVVDSSGGLTPRQAMELLRAQRAQANAQARARNAQEQAPTQPAIQAAITPGTLIANLLQNKNGKIFLIGRSDRRATHRTRSEIVAALALCGREDLAPKLKTNKAQFGEVMRSLNAPGLRMRAWNVTRRDVQRQAQEWPVDLASRWCVGVLDGTDALGSLGEKVLIADLKTNNEIVFTGGSDTMRQKVNEAFTARMGDESYNATDLLNWFRRMMQEQFHVASLASDMFLPGDAEATAPVCDMIATLRPILSRSIVEIDAVTGDGLLDGLMEGLFEEIEEIQEDFRVAQVKASERDVAALLKKTPNASGEEQELAARRAVVLGGAASSFIRRLNEKTDRVTGYEALLGTERVKPVRDLIAQLRATIAPLCDDTSMMAANIELD